MGVLHDAVGRGMWIAGAVSAARLHFGAMFSGRRYRFLQADPWLLLSGRQYFEGGSYDRQGGCGSGCEARSVRYWAAGMKVMLGWAHFSVENEVFLTVIGFGFKS